MARTRRWSKRVGGAVGTATLLIIGTAILAHPAGAVVTPIAYEDAYADGLGNTISVSAPGFLANDFGVSSAYQAKLVDTTLDDGTLDFHTNGSFTFDPKDDGRGEYDFSYCIAPAGGGDCVSNTVLVRLFNGEPYVPDHSYSTSQDAVLDVPAPGLLQDAQNRTSGDYLYVTRDPDFGTLDAQQSGAFTYTPPPNFIGTDTFNYCISNDADIPGCEGLDSMTGIVSVYPAASSQSFSVPENGSHSGGLYPAPSGGVTFTGLVTTSAQHGTVDVNNDGTFDYTPNAGYFGPDSFAFCISQDDQNCVAGGSSATVSITVTPLNVDTTLTLVAPASAPYSALVNLVATVSPADATGSVAFFDGGTPIAGCGAVAVSSGSATCTPPGALAVGPHGFTATFSGSGLYLDSTAGPVTTTVTQAPTAINYTGATSAVTGASFTASATLTRTAIGSVPLPGQTLTFSVPGDSCSATTDASGSASCALTAPTPGPASVSVTYAGDPDDAPSATEGVVEVGLIATATAVTADQSSALWGTPITFTATVTPTATGTVAFSVAGTPIAGCAAVALTSGAAACTTAGLDVGADQITATYSGDATHSGSAGQTAVIIAARPTTLGYTGATGATVGQPLSVSAVLTDTTAGDGIAGQPLTFTLGVLSCTATTDANGSGSCTITPTAVSQAGTLTDVYAGDAQHVNAQASADITVAPAATTTTVSAPTDAVFTTSVVLTATVAPTDDAGAVTFSLNGTAITGCDSVVLASGGVATCTTSALPVGTDAVIATFSGTADYLSSSGSATVTVAPAPTALTYTGDTTATVSEPMTVSAVLNNTAGTAAPIADQALVFELAGTTCTADTAADGSARCALVPSDVADSGPLTVSYAGTSDYLASQTSTTVTVAAVTTTTTVTGPSSGTFALPITYTATVAPSAGNGTVAFTSNGAPLAGCAAVPLTQTGGSWQAACTTSALAVGSDTVTADYSGDPSYLASSGSLDVSVQMAPTALAYTGDTTATVGAPLTVGATLTVATGGTMPQLRQLVPAADAAPATIPVVGLPVTFTLGSLTCSATTGTDGSAGCTITPTAVAQSGALVTSFTGTSNYLPAQTTTPITVARATSAVTLTAAKPSVVSGSADTLTATVQPTDGGGTVTFASAGKTLCSAVALASASGGWQASCSTTALPVGTDRVIATYSGDPNYTGADAATEVRVSAPAAQTPPLATTGANTAPLATTGANVEPLVGLGLLLLAGGGLTVFAGLRRRRTHA